MSKSNIIQKGFAAKTEDPLGFDNKKDLLKEEDKDTDDIPEDLDSEPSETEDKA